MVLSAGPIHVLYKKSVISKYIGFENDVNGLGKRTDGLNVYKILMESRIYK